MYSGIRTSIVGSHASKYRTIHHTQFLDWSCPTPKLFIHCRLGTTTLRWVPPLTVRVPIWAPCPAVRAVPSLEPLTIPSQARSPWFVLIPSAVRGSSGISNTSIHSRWSCSWICSPRCGWYPYPRTLELAGGHRRSSPCRLLRLLCPNAIVPKLILLITFF